MIVWDDLDRAIVGVGTKCGMKPCLVYDFDRLIGLFSKDGMSAEEAEEWIVYNIENCHVGSQTPILLRRMSQTEVAELLEGLKDGRTDGPNREHDGRQHEEPDCDCDEEDGGAEQAH